MRRPRSSKNDARSAAAPNLVVRFQYVNRNGALTRVFAPFRASSHGIVQLKLAPALAPQGDAECPNIAAAVKGAQANGVFPGRERR